MSRNLKLTAIASLTALSIVAGGCSAEPEARMQPPSAPGTPPGTPLGPGEPIGEPTPPTAKYAGVYSAVAPIDLTQNGVLPGVLGPALNALIELHDHPGQAILDIIAIANIPTVSDLVKNMPQLLKDILSGALDKLITDEVYANVPVVDQITNIISGITELAKTMELHNSLTVHTPKADGTATIDQQVTDIGFKLLNNSTVVAFDAKEQMMAHTAMPGSVKAHANAPVADADLTLGGGTMTLPFGELLLQAAGPLVFGQFGGATDLKGALHNLVDCASAAQAISDDLGGYLSPSVVQTICTSALDAIANSVTNSIDNITLNDVQVSAGTATLLDVSQSKPTTDYQSDRVSQGKWNWSFSVAGSTVTVPSTFSGDRIGDAQ
ncbi:MAG TPA: hypothetical protein VN947_19265 [Polyangia bacterium]|nr:hypothetical protein [Polyangia bacterium]